MYSAYIERPWLARAIGRLVWGVDLRPLYASIAGLGSLRGTVVDVPCGGGLELRGLRDVDLVAVDIERAMLERTRVRAAELGLAVRTVRADMRELPLEDASADAGLSYSGLHMIDDPERAVAELARVVRPGGRLAGSTFVADAGRRQRALFAAGERQGHPGLKPRAAFEGWLADAGFKDIRLEGDGFVVFSATR